MMDQLDACEDEAEAKKGREKGWVRLQRARNQDGVNCQIGQSAPEMGNMTDGDRVVRAGRRRLCVEVCPAAAAARARMDRAGRRWSRE
ncbi:hypothetical protein CPLU01_04570 [Colletotrichum plurivorum]|uniref:Uncharacterized protein n=1 Tax=Colletotrichum plurivorum TaxID=2175906 RepID=A0A8H6KP60_9PEZI|nr:hypothetical protein CPLU01_04570 [Colletotrichum plurivorum]